MRFLKTISAALCMFLFLPSVRADKGFGGGPAKDPESLPDWGGTPDVISPADVGLSTEELNALLARLDSADEADRARALNSIIRDASGSEAVFREALFDGRGLRNTQMKAAVRAAARNADDSPDALLKALAVMDPTGEPGVKGALRILSMLHALSSLDTMAAYKVMIEFSPRHAGIFRAQIGKMLCSHKMKVMPALVYGRGSKNKEIHMFSVKWIRDLGNPLLSEQIKIENPRRLAQLLEAYASVNDLDTIDVILSLTDHSSAFVRAAARGSAAVFGRNVLWPARRQYENIFGKAPDASMTVEDVLAALYKRYDSRRLAESRELFAAGLTAFREGRLEDMDKAFREVLKKSPMFPRRGEAAPGFFALAESFDEDDIQKKEAALMMVLRVTDDESSKVYRAAKARLLWLRSKPLREKGLAAPRIYRRISKLDPSFEGAADMLRALRPDAVSKTGIVVKALLVSLIIFLGGFLIILRLRRARTR